MKKLNKFANITLILTVLVILKIFVFEIFLIPSDSMRETIMPGDFVLVSKIFKNIHTGDILVFHYPYGDTIFENRPEINYYDRAGRHGRDKALADTVIYGKLIMLPLKYRQPFIKRVMAIPGDSFYLRNENVIINGAKITNSEQVIATGAGYKNAQLPVQKIQRPLPVSATVKPVNPEGYKWLFPHVNRVKWSKRKYGPLYIPRKGDIITLTPDNLCFYKRIIENYEFNKLSVPNGKIFINDTLATEYLIKQDYFFVLGDNRDQSLDSRIWGYVPEDHIIGKAKMILISWDKNERGTSKVRWGRLFRAKGFS